MNKDFFENLGFVCKEYNNGVQLNVTDKAGVIQTFYPTTGTIVLHASNERADRRMKSIRNSNVEYFVELINNPEIIQGFLR